MLFQVKIVFGGVFNIQNIRLRQSTIKGFQYFSFCKKPFTINIHKVVVSFFNKKFYLTFFEVFFLWSIMLFFGRQSWTVRNRVGQFFRNICWDFSFFYIDNKRTEIGLEGHFFRIKIVSHYPGPYQPPLTFAS